MKALDWLRLYRTENIGPVTFFRLIERHGSAEAALEALPAMARRGGKRDFAPCSKSEAEAEMAALDRLGAHLLLADDPRFPEALRLLELSPILILRGRAELLQKRSVAIVGAREASLPGRKIAYRLAEELGAAGFAVVSGMARGIDSAAHQGSLASGTIAVLAGGVDHIYPAENAKLYHQIIEHGCIVSDQRPGLAPSAQHFPRRNRLIAGLAQGVVVVEAALRSGSLITARLGLEQGKEIFAVPGSPLEPRAAGPNSLIKQGAFLVESAADIIDGLGLPRPATSRLPTGRTVEIDEASLSSAHAKVSECLTVTSVTVDEILRQCQLSPATLSMVLLDLELAGRLQRHPDQSLSLRV